tara:strand:+ start:146171 stop:147820 length:1650 start_codon:yes stop_codon:yes gene_type:complete
MGLGSWLADRASDVGSFVVDRVESNINSSRIFLKTVVEECPSGFAWLGGAAVDLVRGVGSTAYEGVANGRWSNPLKYVTREDGFASTWDRNTREFMNENVTENIPGLRGIDYIQLDELKAQHFDELRQSNPDLSDDQISEMVDEWAEESGLTGGVMGWCYTMDGGETWKASDGNVAVAVVAGNIIDPSILIPVTKLSKVGTVIRLADDVNDMRRAGDVAEAAGDAARNADRLSDSASAERAAEQALDARHSVDDVARNADEIADATRSSSILRESLSTIHGIASNPYVSNTVLGVALAGITGHALEWMTGPTDHYNNVVDLLTNGENDLASENGMRDLRELLDADRRAGNVAGYGEEEGITYFGDSTGGIDQEMKEALGRMSETMFDARDIDLENATEEQVEAAIEGMKLEIEFRRLVESYVADPENFNPTETEMVTMQFVMAGQGFQALMDDGVEWGLAGQSDTLGLLDQYLNQNPEVRQEILEGSGMRGQYNSVSGQVYHQTSLDYWDREINDNFLRSEAGIGARINELSARANTIGADMGHVMVMP